MRQTVMTNVVLHVTRSSVFVSRDAVCALEITAAVSVVVLVLISGGLEIVFFPLRLYNSNIVT